MTTEDIIIHVFCKVDDKMPEIPKYRQAKLYPSELVTIGILFALKGGSFRAFYRWLKRDYEALFAGLPDRTRLMRALKVHQEWINSLPAEPTVLTVTDTYRIELLFRFEKDAVRNKSAHRGTTRGLVNWCQTVLVAE